jgi:hypothetical protein
MINTINYLVETCRLPSLPAPRLRELADIFMAAVGSEFLSNPPTARDPISGRARVRHRLLRMLSSPKDAGLAISELAEVGLYLGAFASDSQIRACVDGLRNDYESTLLQLAMAYRLRAAGCTTVHLEPETARGRADVAFTYDGIPFVAECYRLSKGFSDYFAEAQHALYEGLLELVPPGRKYSFTVVIGRVPTFGTFRKIIARFREIVTEMASTPNLFPTGHRFGEHVLGLEDITGAEEDPDLTVSQHGTPQTRRYDDADALFVRELARASNAFEALDEPYCERVFLTRVFVWKKFENPKPKKPDDVLLAKLSTKLKQTKAKQGKVGRILFVEYPFGLFIKARKPESLRHIQQKAISQFEDFSALVVMERRAGRTNRFCYESAILQGRQVNAIPQSLVDRLSIVEQADIFALVKQA